MDTSSLGARNLMTLARKLRQKSTLVSKPFGSTQGAPTAGNKSRSRPRNHRIVSGAKMGSEQGRDEERVNEKADQRLHRLESETSEEVDDSGIETLESKQEDAMKEMAVADALGEILAANAGREGMQVLMEALRKQQI